MTLSIRVDSVPEGTLKWKIFDSDGEYEKTPYIISGLAEPDGRGGCEIVNVQGDASNESNELMATTLRDIGFKYLIFRAFKDQKVTRYAQKIGEEGNFYLYKVPLLGIKTESGR